MTTRPTIEADKAASSVLGAGEWNVNCLQQGRWTQEVLAGTNSDKLPGTAVANPVTFQGSVLFGNDANAGLIFSGLNPTLQLDTGPDSFAYIRATNLFQWIVGGSLILQMTSNGKFTGAGFFDSGDVSVANTGNPHVISTGFGNGGGGAAGEGPMFVWAVYGTTAGVDINIPIGPATVVAFGTCQNTSIQINNNDSGTRIVRVFALTNA